MFSHVMIGVNDMDASRKFYDATLAALGYEPGVMDKKGRCFYRTPKGTFALTTPLDGKPATVSNGSTIGFLAKTTDIANAWHKAGLNNGGTDCEDPPGMRGDVMYLAYLRDPAGHKICALHLVK